MEIVSRGIESKGEHKEFDNDERETWRQIAGEEQGIRSALKPVSIDRLEIDRMKIILKKL